MHGTILDYLKSIIVQKYDINLTISYVFISLHREEEFYEHLIPMSKKINDHYEMRTICNEILQILLREATEAEILISIQS